MNKYKTRNRPVVVIILILVAYVLMAFYSASVQNWWALGCFVLGAGLAHYHFIQAVVDQSKER